MAGTRLRDGFAGLFGIGPAKLFSEDGKPGHDDAESIGVKVC
jgi:hypothetical protein